MKHPLILGATGVALLAVLALVFLVPHAMVAPGDLSAGHAAVSGDCLSCHTPFQGADPKRCTACHAPADIGLRSTLGAPLPASQRLAPFHQQLARDDCMACHSLHKGVQQSRPPAPRFNHAFLKPQAAARCASCHTPPLDTLHRTVGANCAQCHSQARWSPATFDHDRYFRLQGPHATACVSCHVTQDFGRYTCFSCHAHSEPDLRARHLREGIRDIDNCVACHRSGDEDEAEGREGGRREED